jgi:thiol-disulfide isomerase/thioredoxin
MLYLVPPIAYLESKDFTKGINLKNFKNKTCIVMVQANWCGACQAAKPHFQEFASNNKYVVCLTIEEDDKDPQRMDIVKKLKPSFEGFPDYLLFKNGKFINKEINGRTKAALEEFAK